VNPNNCATCEHKNMKSPDQADDDGHCYMFRDEPTEICMQHTGRKVVMIERPSILGVAAMVALLMNTDTTDGDKS